MPEAGAVGGVAILALLAALSTPDHVAILSQPSPRSPPGETVTLYHHAGRDRLENRDGSRVSYQQPGGRLTFNTTGSGNQLTRLDVQKLDAPELPALDARRATGQHETVAGERCAVWRSERDHHGAVIAQSGCATADGVQLWRESGGMKSLIATHVERRPVSAAKVAPPFSRLDPLTWVAPDQRSSPTDGYEVVLQTPGAGARVERRITRHAGPWTSTRLESGDRVSRLTLTHSGADLWFDYYDAGARAGLTITKGAQPRTGPDPAVRQPGRPDEVVLGQACQWWDLTPNVMDYSEFECRTAAGVALKSEIRSRGGGRSLVAVSFARRSIPLSQILPGPEITSPTAWREK